ncbi:serine hydrolase domain-containing protein [Nonomuraea pusilla]|uniref:serine hydrolase domain-containing protein n=1 Tax=Nonomuraea pusilla TaxID=46177 RepID=UPI003327FEEE
MIDPSDLAADLAEAAAPAMARTGTPGLVIGVLVGDERRYHCAGVTSVRDPRPVTPETLFRYCSITKPITAIAVMSAREQGLLDLDQPVADLVPGLPGADGVTVRHLLDHTSGGEGEWPGDMFAFGANDDAQARLIAEFGVLRRFAPPGAAFGYCNPGYWLLGEILARLDGVPVEQALRRRVLDPLGLADVVTGTDEAIVRPVALPHAAGPDGGQRLLPRMAFPRARFASGGLIGSARALLDLAADQLAETSGVLTAGSRTLMAETRVPAERPGRFQGLGWAIDGEGPDVSLGHSGSFSGYVSHLQLFPRHGAAVALLANSGAGWEARTAVHERMLERLGTGRPAAPEPIDGVDATGRGGSYAYPGCRELVLEPSDDGLLARFVRLDGTVEPTARARPVSPEEFVLLDGPLPGNVLRFLPNVEGGIRIGLRLGARLAP